MNRIFEIKTSDNNNVIPDGIYQGKMTGWEVTFKDSNDKTHTYTEKFGLRGANIDCTVTVTNGVPSVTDY